MYESYFKDPQFKRNADKIILEFKKLKKTLTKINVGMKADINRIDKYIKMIEENPSEEVIQQISQKLYDIKIDMYALIGKGDSIISDMKMNYFRKSEKLEFKNKEIIEEYYEISKLLKEKIEYLEEVLKNGGKREEQPNTPEDSKEG